MNTQEWMQKFFEHQADMRDLVEQYHPVATMGRDGTIAGKPVAIDAQGAEDACAVVRQVVRDRIKVWPPEQFDAAVPKGDVRALVLLLNDAWFGMPESLASREVPGFGVLCDLAEGPDDMEFGDEDEE